MRRKLSVGLVLILSMFFLLTGCGQKTTTPSQPSQPSTSTNEPNKSAEPKTLNIGYTGPMSGGGALFGKDVTEGLDMAVDEINDKGGLNVNGQRYFINLVKLDDQYLPDKAATNARRLVTEYETPIIFVPHSGGAFALQQFNETDNFLLMAFTSEPKISLTGNKLTVQMTSPYNLYPEIYSQKVMEKFGKKLALIPTSSQYGKDWTANLVPAWEKLGGTVVADVPVDYNKEVDFSTYVSKALAANPDVLFVGGPSQPTAMVIKQARQMGFKGGFIVMDQAKLDQIATFIPMSDLEGAIGVTPLSLYPSEGRQPFIDRFKAKYDGKEPSWEASKNYDHFILLAKGIEKAGVVDDPAKILEGMRAVCPLEGTEITTFIPGIAEGGGSMTPGAGIMVENGQFGEHFSIPNPAAK